MNFSINTPIECFEDKYVIWKQSDDYKYFKSCTKYKY